MSQFDPARSAALANLRWQVEMGAVEGITDAPVDRFSPAGQILPPPAAARTATTRTPPSAAADTVRPEIRKVASASAAATRAIAEGCGTINALRQALEDFDGSPLQAGARRTVIADGNPKARVMILGEAPGAEEDRQGLPFVGAAGKLLDQALAHIGLSREAENPQESFYITNIVYWRPPANRNPTPEEVTPLMPFCERHIVLAEPDLLLLLGNIACQNLLRTSTGITRLRGTWKRWTPSGGGRSIPALPSFHPSFLLRTPNMKRLFWRDLLSLRVRLDGENGESDDS